MCFVPGGSRVPAQQLVVTLNGRVAIDTLHAVADGGSTCFGESAELSKEKSDLTMRQDHGGGPETEALNDAAKGTSVTGRAEAFGWRKWRVRGRMGSVCAQAYWTEGAKECLHLRPIVQYVSLGQVAAKAALRHGDADETRAEPMEAGTRFYVLGRRAQKTRQARGGASVGGEIGKKALRRRNGLYGLHGKRVPAQITAGLAGSGCLGGGTNFHAAGQWKSGGSRGESAVGCAPGFFAACGTVIWLGAEMPARPPMRVERTGNVRPGRDRDTKGRLWERRRLATAWAAGDDADTDTDADGHGQHGGADGDDDDAAAAAAGADASDAPPLVMGTCSVERNIVTVVAGSAGRQAAATGGGGLLRWPRLITSHPVHPLPPPQASEWVDGQGDAQNAAGG
ncbi:hypothetical protein COCVIDRAFT_13140 [Bipolaris victoriae FI3]|uniref:Uncharacterized protein n=1 Tax=Bipolaris victoriae (strain FI3) TaxID=930091 RepID=W7EQY1_BIPV3|nr:hypothetical protein COCVIDRAFT_13140 [Bipolaris victoriae FI3]